MTQIAGFIAVLLLKSATLLQLLQPVFEGKRLVTGRAHFMQSTRSIGNCASALHRFRESEFTLIAAEIRNPCC